MAKFTDEQKEEFIIRAREAMQGFVEDFLVGDEVFGEVMRGDPLEPVSIAGIEANIMGKDFVTLLDGLFEGELGEPYVTEVSGE